MHINTAIFRAVLCLGFIYGAMGTTSSATVAQSQEAKPGQETATPPSAAATPVRSLATTGLSDSTWQSPIWGIQITWHPDIWTVENELIEDAYEGIQLGSDASTVFFEAYVGHSGSAEECLATAEREIAERPNTREVTRLSGPALPENADGTMTAQLFGVVAELADGAIYRGTEYVACRSLEPGAAVLETTWQTAVSSYNDERSRVSELFATLTIPEAAGG